MGSDKTEVSKKSESEVEVLIPKIKSVQRLLKFRLEAKAEGGALEYTDDILITAINCDIEGPKLKDEIETFSIEEK